MIVVKKKEIAEPKLVLSLLNWFGFVEGRGILGVLLPCLPLVSFNLVHLWNRKISKRCGFCPLFTLTVNKGERQRSDIAEIKIRKRTRKGCEGIFPRHPYFKLSVTDISSIRQLNIERSMFNFY